MRNDAKMVYQVLTGLGTREGAEKEFDEARARRGLVEALEWMGAGLFKTAMLAELIAPLIDAYDHTEPDAWLRMVREQRAQAVKMLINGHFKANSTSAMANLRAMSEAEAASYFVQRLERVLRDD